MSLSADDVREQVLHVARAMHTAGLVVGTAGNVSGRMPGGDTVCMTPASMPYDTMTVEDLVVVDLDGHQVGETGGRPTSEKALHLECYRQHREVGGVVHTHPAHASMFAVARQPIPAAVEEVAIYLGGDVPCGDYRMTGTAGLGREVALRLADRSAVLLANHGLLCIGRHAEDALHSALVVERTAQIVWGARVLGAITEVPVEVNDDFVAAYRDARRRWRDS